MKRTALLLTLALTACAGAKSPLAAAAHSPAPDWHEVAEADFIRSVAHRLDETVRSQGVKDLVIVAPPRTLGELRSFLSSSVRTIITSEVDKELARLTTAEIERHLAALSKLP